MRSQSGGYESAPGLAEYYDLVPAYASRGDVGFYVDCARRAGGRVLELGCGTGRVLVPTARAGYEIVGLDISEPMLARCREKLSLEPEAVQRRVALAHGDMRDFSLGDSFAVVTTPFRSFQHLIGVEEQVCCLLCVNRHLVMGGKLILDVFHVDPQRMYDPRRSLEVEDTPEFVLPDGRRLRRTNRAVAFHRAQQYNDVELIYYVSYPDGRTDRLVHAFPLRYFFRYEVEHLLARCGFTVSQLFGNYDGSPFGDDSPEMIFVAEKSEMR